MPGKQQEYRENNYGMEYQTCCDLKNYRPALRGHGRGGGDPIAELRGVLAQQVAAFETTGPHLNVAGPGGTRNSPERWRREMGEATPGAAASNTEDSPHVSQAPITTSRPLDTLAA